MPYSISSIQAPIDDSMKAFEGKFKTFMKTKVMLLDTIMHYIVQRKGKQMRPMFVFLTAGCMGEITEKTFRGAALIELLHTATLVMPINLNTILHHCLKWDIEYSLLMRLHMAKARENIFM